jgi:hypothetical protein
MGKGLTIRRRRLVWACHSRKVMVPWLRRLLGQRNGAEILDVLVTAVHLVELKTKPGVHLLGSGAIRFYH